MARAVLSLFPDWQSSSGVRWWTGSRRLGSAPRASSRRTLAAWPLPRRDMQWQPSLLGIGLAAAGDPPRVIGPGCGAGQVTGPLTRALESRASGGGSHGPAGRAFVNPLNSLASSPRPASVGTLPDPVPAAPEGLSHRIGLFAPAPSRRLRNQAGEPPGQRSRGAGHLIAALAIAGQRG